MTVLKPGDAGPEVAELQVLLAQLGHDVGRPDGKFGPRTQTAVTAIQQQAGIAVDGLVGPDTRRAIDEADTREIPLRRGMPVRRLQSILTRSGYDAGAIDGTYGETTEAAVKVLQGKHGLTQDGFVGPETWVAVNSLP